MNVGQRIKECRVKMGITVDELAVKLHKNRATVYRYEKGDIENLPITILEPIANALETSPAFLMGWIEDSRPFPEDHTAKTLMHTPEVFAPTSHELSLLKAYRSQPNMQAAVDRLLGITGAHIVRVEGKVAARGFKEKSISNVSTHNFEEVKKKLEHSSEEIDF